MLPVHLVLTSPLIFFFVCHIYTYTNIGLLGLILLGSCGSLNTGSSSVGGASLSGVKTGMTKKDGIPGCWEGINIGFVGKGVGIDNGVGAGATDGIAIGVGCGGVGGTAASLGTNKAGLIPAVSNEGLSSVLTAPSSFAFGGTAEDAVGALAALFCGTLLYPGLKLGVVTLPNGDAKGIVIYLFFSFPNLRRFVRLTLRSAPS